MSASAPIFMSFQTSKDICRDSISFSSLVFRVYICQSFDSPEYNNLRLIFILRYIKLEEFKELLWDRFLETKSLCQESSRQSLLLHVISFCSVLHVFLHVKRRLPADV